MQPPRPLRRGRLFYSVKEFTGDFGDADGTEALELLFRADATWMTCLQA
jgi:hypothetical protein